MNFIAVQKNDYYLEIHKRISGITDLQALQAKYHADCYNLIKNSIHLSNVDKKVAPRFLMIDTAIEQIYTYIEENDGCQFPMQELRNGITTEYIPDEKTIRKRLIDRSHDDIVISCKFGSHNIICFKKISHNILTENWYGQKHSSKEEEELHILKAASFCASYKEATLYEASATFATPPEIKLGIFAQFVHDNADLNINTIDGKATLHYMGSIEVITSADSIQPGRPIKRLKTLPPESEFAKKWNIPLQMYPASVGTGFSNIIIKLSEVDKNTSFLLSSLLLTTDAEFEHLKRVYL
ncbi:uncharacterized protein TNCV_1995971 [Trichonephila clavipes]|uniref:Uncharacterized protein n=1 Tax=Trichonephila clavipes TaxID=2585209 RepID=A0A8X6RMD6_TRICX|nr:uncharacterized protein TNCV_1995971 [Trichonephila clavipes]